MVLSFIVAGIGLYLTVTRRGTDAPADQELSIKSHSGLTVVATLSAGVMLTLIGLGAGILTIVRYPKVLWAIPAVVAGAAGAKKEESRRRKKQPRELYPGAKQPRGGGMVKPQTSPRKSVQGRKGRGRSK